MSTQRMVDDLRDRLSVLVDPAQAKAIEAVLALLDSPEPFSSVSFSPGHVTASAFVIHPTRRAVALVLHGKLRRWLQPGGHVEPSDTSIVVAAIREVGEEIGVTPVHEPWLLDVDIHTFPARHDVPVHLHYDVRVAFRADSSRLVVGDGADDVRWWSFEEALTLDESVARPVRRLDATLSH